MTDARRTLFAIKLSISEAALCDQARGDLPRSEWGRSALLAAAGAEVPAGTRKRGAPVKPLTADCTHPKSRVHRGLCGACGTGGL